LTLNCTPTTPTLSEALAASVTVPFTVEPLVGLVSEMPGAVLSDGGADVPSNGVAMSP
jgi:hypothetical protein